MVKNPIIQKLIDLIEVPENGRSASPTSEFARRRNQGSDPHGGFDLNRGHAVGGSVSSPVYGIIGKGGGGKYGKIIIHEVDPVTKQLTGVDIEILHTQAQYFRPGEKVEPGQVIGSEGGVGADGVSHAHVQVFRGTDSTPLNPLRHLYEYHHPDQSVPSLPELSPYSVPPKHGPRRDPANDPIFQTPGEWPAGRGPSLPQTMPPGGNPSARAPLQLSPGSPIPGVEGPSSVGGPNGPTVLVPPVNAPRGPVGSTQTPAPTLAPLYFAPPSPLPSFGPFTLPDNSGGSGNESPQPPNQASAFDDRSGNASGKSSPDTQLRRVSSAYPGMTPPDPDQRVLPQPGGLLGLFSGKPMPSWTVPPPLGGLLNNSNASGNNDAFNLMAGLVSRNPTPPELPPQTADGIPERRLGRSTYSVSPAPAYDPGAAAPPLAPFDDSNYAGGVLGRFPGLDGSDPNQPAPLDDEQQQAKLQALEDRFARSGSINDAWELYQARIASRG